MMRTVSRLFFFFFAVIPIWVLSWDIKQNGHCFQVEKVVFNPKSEFFFNFSDAGIVITSIWDHHVFANEMRLGRSLFKTFDECDGTTLIFVDTCKGFLSHYFHFLEHLLGIWEFGACEERHNIKRIIFCSEEDKNKDFDWRGVNQISEKLIVALFPNAEVFTLKQFKEKYKQPICFNRVLLSSRIVTFRDPECLKVNKMLGKIWSSLTPEKMDRFRSLIFSHCDVALDHDRKCPRITYLYRHAPRRLSPKLEKHLLSSIGDLVGYSIPVTDLAKIPYEEQLRIIANTDILISVHGNGLSHIPFLPPHATAIELFPTDSFAWDYFLMAKIRRIDYWGNSKNIWVTPLYDPQSGPFGDVNREVNIIDIEKILSIISDKIQRMGCN